MGMPNDLILVRHGESEGNVAVQAAGKGNHSYFTDAYMTTPGHQWRLTSKGQAQAKAMGLWLESEISARFDRYYVSPYVRTRETAAGLALPGASWSLNRALRERDWGDIGSMRKDHFESSELYATNHWMQKHDPLYWVAPGGESIAQVAEDRVRNVLSTLHRETTGARVLAVTHSETMWAFRLVLERLSDEEFVALDKDKSEKINNCEAFHYSRINPRTGVQSRRLSWLRRSRPIFKDGNWVVEVGEWSEFRSQTFSNQELLDQVESVPYLIEQPSL